MLIMYDYVTAKRFIIVSSSTGKRPKISLGELNLPLGREVPGESKSKNKKGIILRQSRRKRNRSKAMWHFIR